MKDIIETSFEHSKVDPEGRYELRLSDIETLLSVVGGSRDGIYNALIFSYHAGLVRGARAEKARRKKGTK